MMIKQRAEHGWTFRRACGVLEVLFSDSAASRSGLQDAETARNASECERRVVVTDAGGQGAMDRSRIGLARVGNGLKEAASTWTYWKGAQQRTAEGRGRYSWMVQDAGKKWRFWYIPLHNDVMRSGTVLASYGDLLQDPRRQGLEKIISRKYAKVRASRLAASRTTTAMRVFRVPRSIRIVRACAGDGVVTVGDALASSIRSTHRACCWPCVGC